MGCVMNLPIRAFCLNGYNEKIELQITELLGFPDNTSYEGGYDVRGTLHIVVGCYTVHTDNFYFATGVLYRLDWQLRFRQNYSEQEISLRKYFVSIMNI